MICLRVLSYTRHTFATCDDAHSLNIRLARHGICQSVNCLGTNDMPRTKHKSKITPREFTQTLIKRTAKDWQRIYVEEITQRWQHLFGTPEFAAACKEEKVNSDAWRNAHYKRLRNINQRLFSNAWVHIRGAKRNDMG